jgi:hypothetical protein
MSDEIKKDEQVPEAGAELSSEPLPESELDKVVGGEVSLAYGKIAVTYTEQTPDSGGPGWLGRNINIKPS